MSVQVPESKAAPSLEVVEAIAAREGLDTTDLDVSLYESIDPDALDALVETSRDRPARSPIRVQFSYHGYDVTVSSDGSLSVRAQGRR